MLLNHSIPALYLYRNQSPDLHCKSSDWFLHVMQDWAEMSWNDVEIVMYLSSIFVTS